MLQAEKLENLKLVFPYLWHALAHGVGTKYTTSNSTNYEGSRHNQIRISGLAMLGALACLVWIIMHAFTGKSHTSENM